jgi:hypothetical protein
VCTAERVINSKKLWAWLVTVKVKTVGQSVNLSWCQAPIWNSRTICLLLSLIICRRILIWCRAPSLTRSRVCSFQFLLGIASTTILRSESHGLMTIFYCLYFWDSPNLEGQVPVIISPRNRVGIGLGITSQRQSQSHVTTDCQSASMSWCRVHSGTWN